MDVQAALKNQYHAALATLKQTVERCPDGLWDGDAYPVAFWRVAYHTLFFTHLYLQPNFEAFRPWASHRAEHECLGRLPYPPFTEPKIGAAYGKSQILEYWTICDQMVDSTIDLLDLDSKESGFPWYKIPKLEHQIVNIRHIQNHAAALACRVRAAGGEVDWIGGV
jgi:hypothetical protein